MESTDEPLTKDEWNFSEYFDDVFEERKRTRFDLERRSIVSGMIRRVSKEDVLGFLRKKHKRITFHIMHMSKRARSAFLQYIKNVFKRILGLKGLMVVSDGIKKIL